jgi:hypothetical protein
VGGLPGIPARAAYWTYDLGTDCCGNDELETYTNSRENVHLDGLGHLDAGEVSEGAAAEAGGLIVDARRDSRGS